jgi:hypothetical protein
MRDLLGALVDGGAAATRAPIPELAAGALGAGAFVVSFTGGPERLMATLIALLALVLVTGFGFRATAVFSRSEGLRAAGMGAALAGALLAAGLALWNLYPGTPEAEVDVPAGGSAEMELPPGAHRLLLNGHLPHDRTTDEAKYVLTVGDREIAGRFERTFVQGRAGKRSGLRTSQDHTSSFHDAELAGAHDVSLRVTEGKLDGTLHVAAYPGLPVPLVYGLPLVVLAVAAVLDDRLGLRLRLSVPVAAGLGFGLLMHASATPQSAAGAALGSAVLGFGAGVAAAFGASLATRALLPRP